MDTRTITFSDGGEVPVSAVTLPSLIRRSEEDLQLALGWLLAERQRLADRVAANEKKVAEIAAEMWPQAKLEEEHQAAAAWVEKHF